MSQSPRPSSISRPAGVGRKIRALSKHTWNSQHFCHTTGRKIRLRARKNQIDAPVSKKRSPFARAGEGGGPSQRGGGGGRGSNMGLFVHTNCLKWAGFLNPKITVLAAQQGWSVCPRPAACYSWCIHPPAVCACWANVLLLK